MGLNQDAIASLQQGTSEGNRVARAIELSGLTQALVAKATGLPQPYVSDVARNRYQTITVENARRFAEFFGVSIEILFPPSKEAA